MSENVLLFPPSDRSRPKPLFVMLHGMCGAPEHACAHFAASTAELGWLVCPRAERRCEGGGSTWTYPDRLRTIARAVELAHARFPGEIDESSGRTLIGFSLGAFVATDLAQQGAGHYPRVLLIGARVLPAVGLLKRAGVERMVFAAGRYDITYAHMSDQARRLARAGLPAHFIDLGRTGHRFPANFPSYLAEALVFLGATPPNATPPRSAKSSAIGRLVEADQREVLAE